MYLLSEFSASQEELIHDITCRVIPKKEVQMLIPQNDKLIGEGTNKMFVIQHTQK